MTLNIPKTAPVMILPKALLVPMTLLPLSIFEPRYREMLAYALENDRMFCIALLKPGVLEATNSNHFFHTVGLGLIRACVGLHDGTSNLILQGVARARITGFTQEEPFRIAKLEELKSECDSVVKAEALAEKVLEACREFKSLGAPISEPMEKQIESISDPGTLADIVAHAMIQNPFTRQCLLEETSVTKRLHDLLRLLQAQLGV